MIWFYYPETQWYPYAVVLLATILKRRGFKARVVARREDLRPGPDDVLCLSLLSKYLAEQEEAGRHSPCRLVIGGPCATGEPLEYWQKRFGRQDITLVRRWADDAIQEAVEMPQPGVLERAFSPTLLQHIDLSLMPIDTFDPGFEQESFDVWASLSLGESYDSWRRRAGIVQTARGCPYSCSYCANPLFGSHYWPFDIEFVLDDLEMWHRAGASWFIMADAAFAHSQRHAKEVCRGILNRGLRVHWNCEGTLAGWTPELLQLMKAAGCFDIRCGLESASLVVREEYGKRHLSLDHIAAGIYAAREVGVHVNANVIVGARSETDDTIRETIDFINRHAISYFNVFYLASFMGSRVYYEVGKETNEPYHPRDRLERWGRMICEETEAKNQVLGELTVPDGESVKHRL